MSAAISLLIYSGGSVNFFVCGSAQIKLRHQTGPPTTVVAVWQSRTRLYRAPSVANRVDTEFDQIRQALRDSSQVANAVVVTVLKRPRIDLIDDPGLPPKYTLHETH